MNDWNIQGRPHGCEACGKAFIDKQHYHTLLFDQKQMFQRQDICAPCWENQHSHDAKERKGFISYWQGVYHAPPPPAPEPIQKENAESLLRKVMESHDPKYAAASYILAVMLERKRLLKVKEQIHRDGQRIFIYEHGKSGDLFTIPDPNLQLDQLAQVQQDVAHLLEHGFEPSTPAPTETAPAAEPVAASSESVSTPSEPVPPTADNTTSTPPDSNQP